MERVDQIVAKIKEKVFVDLPAYVERDRVLLTDVATKLGLAITPAHLAQVFILMKQNFLTTHAEYPKWAYPDGDDRPGVVVDNAAAEKAALSKLNRPSAAVNNAAVANVIEPLVKVVK